MSVRLICLILVVVTSSSAVEALNQNSGMYIGELPNQGIHYFKVDEIPSNITVYWDYEEDRVVDDIYVCPMVASGKTRRQRYLYLHHLSFTRRPSLLHNNKAMLGL